MVTVDETVAMAGAIVDLVGQGAKEGFCCCAVGQK